MSSAARVVDAPTLLMVNVRRLPEGVYLGTSDDLPGLIVEASSREELIDEAREVAKALLEETGEAERAEKLQLGFIFD